VAVGTSALRFAIIVVLVVVGAVLIAEFPRSSARLAAGSATPSQSVTPTPTGTGTASGGGQGPSTPQVRGVKLAVYNGTYQTGLAADAASALVDRYGYKINAKNSILDAPSRPVDQTTLYYVTGADKVEAQALADSYFKKLDVKVAKLPAGSTVPKGVRVAVYLGTDYAQSR
jgi:hypothetical protein